MAPLTNMRSSVNKLINDKNITSVDGGKTEVKLNNGSLEYQITGTKHIKLFGLIPFDLNKQLSVSTNNGQVTEINSSLLDKILSTLSF